MAVATFIQYVVLTANYRAIAAGMYGAAGLTAALAALIGFLIVRAIAKSEGWWGLVGCMGGGALADMVGIALTRSWR